MKQEKVFIVASHSRRPSKDRLKEGQWEVTERVEFVNQLRQKHIQTSTIAVEYIEEKVIIGKMSGVIYEEFIKYVTNRYPKQMEQLQQIYKPSAVVENAEPMPESVLDSEVTEIPESEIKEST